MVSNVKTSPWAPPGWNAPGSREKATETLTATVLAAVEGQLTEYVRGVAAQLAEAQRIGADSQAEMRIDLISRLDERAAELTRVHDAQLAELAARSGSVDAQLTDLVSRFGSVDERLGSFSQQFDEQVTARTGQLEGQLAALAQRLDGHVAALTQRFDEQLGSLGQRLDQQSNDIGTKVVELQGAIDDLQQRLAATDERLTELTETVGQVDTDAIEEMKRETSRAVGEATLVRIELDRVLTTTSERFDKATVRMGEIEALLADDMDVSAAVQLERLEELERALAEIDPNQFVRKDQSDTTSPATGTTEQRHQSGPPHDAY